MDRKSVVEKARELMKDPELVEALTEEITQHNGTLGFLLGMLKRRERTFSPFLLKGISIYKEPHSIDRKTAELAAIAAAAALRCEHCLEAHMHRALREGASMDEVMDVLLIAGAIADSSTLSVAFRKFRQLEGNEVRHQQGENR